MVTAPKIVNRAATFYVVPYTFPGCFPLPPPKKEAFSFLDLEKKN